MCLRGSACIYQGEELGLGEADVAYEDIQDPYGIEFWPEFKGRDGCRTPMVWKQDNQNGGFTEGKPWLPVASEHLPQSVSAQEADEQALIHHYRRAIAFRHAHKALSIGEHDEVKADGDIVYFQRVHKSETILCIFNMSGSATNIAVPEGNWNPIGDALGSAVISQLGNVALDPWQVCLAIKA